jgi:hypothetical protein
MTKIAPLEAHPMAPSAARLRRRSLRCPVCKKRFKVNSRGRRRPSAAARAASAPSLPIDVGGEPRWHGFPPPHRRGGLNAFLFRVNAGDLLGSLVAQSFCRCSLGELLGTSPVPQFILVFAATDHALTVVRAALGDMTVLAGLACEVEGLADRARGLA